MQNHTHDNESKEEEEPFAETKHSQAMGSEKPTKEQVSHVLRSLSPDQLIDLLVPFVQNDPNVYNALVREAESDVHRRKLFVHGVPARTTEEQFKTFFQTFGEVELVELPHAKVHSEVKFGFVVFAKLSGLQNALAQPNKFFEGKEICCKAFTLRSPVGDHSPLGGVQQNRKVFVSGLGPNISERELAEYFRAHGEVEVAQIMPGKSTGYVLFADPLAARDAINRLNRTMWNGRQLSVAWFRKQEDGRLERRASLQSMTSVTSATSYSNPQPMAPAFPPAPGPNWYGYTAFMQQDPYVLVPVYPNEFTEYPPDVFSDARGRV